MQPLIFWLALYTSLEHDKRNQIQDQLAAIPPQQDLMALAQALRNCEAQFLATQRLVLERIRPALAANALSLLSTPMLEAFVETLSLDLQQRQPEQTLQIDANPELWQLTALETPLHLSVLDVQSRLDPAAPSRAHLVVPMIVHLGAWQHQFDVHTATVSGGETDTQKQFYCSHPIAQRWLELCGSLEAAQVASHLYPVCPCLPALVNTRVAIEELACLLVYVSEVFNLFSVQEHITPLLFGASQSGIALYLEQLDNDTAYPD